MGARVVAIVLASIAYVVGTYWLMTRPGNSPWNAVGVLAPMLIAIAVGAWRGGQRWLGAIAALVLAWLCAEALMGVAVPPNLLYLGQHAGIHLFLAAGFGSTLRTGHTPLVTTMAARVHRELTPGMVAYTRKLTLAWVIYFIAMAGVSLGLYAYAPFETWAVFANLLTPISLVLMFGGEYVLRYRWHPEFERVDIPAMIRSYRQTGKPTA